MLFRSTGNRRFWPIDVADSKPTKDLFKDLNKELVGQIWAEAVKIYEGGETLYLPKEMEEMARAKQVEHSERDDRVGMVQEYLDIPLPDGWGKMKDYERRAYILDDLAPREGKPRKQVCVAEIWCECLGKNKADLNRKESREIGNVMRGLEGWEELKEPRPVQMYGRQRVFRKCTQSSNL